MEIFQQYLKESLEHLLAIKLKQEVKTAIDYKSPNHFNQSNEFAHVRFKTRILPNGKKVLAVEEMQSDLLQASKQ
jgi:hypothetical protein